MSGSSSYFVATYTIKLSTSAVAGQAYSLFTDSISAATGWVGSQPDFLEEAFASQANLTINVSPSAVPEPSTYAAIFGVVVLGFCVSRRRRQEV